MTTQTASPASARHAGPLSAAEAVVAGLVAAGVTEIFGIAGGKFAPLLAAIDREPRLRWIGTRHEAAATRVRFVPHPGMPRFGAMGREAH